VCEACQLARGAQLAGCRPAGARAGWPNVSQEWWVAKALIGPMNAILSADRAAPAPTSTSNENQGGESDAGRRIERRRSGPGSEGNRPYSLQALT
jgi:hypothetical protein